MSAQEYISDLQGESNLWAGCSAYALVVEEKKEILSLGCVSHFTAHNICKFGRNNESLFSY